MTTVIIRKVNTRWVTLVRRVRCVRDVPAVGDDSKVVVWNVDQMLFEEGAQCLTTCVHFRRASHHL